MKNIREEGWMISNSTQYHGLYVMSQEQFHNLVMKVDELIDKINELTLSTDSEKKEEGK